MKRFASIFTIVTALLSSKPALADEFTGDVKAACEATLCLSSGKRPSECNSAIKRYYSIRMRKFSDTLKARKNFLKLCPSASQPEMEALTDSIADHTSRCEFIAANPQWKLFYDQGSGTDCNTPDQENSAYIR